MKFVKKSGIFIYSYVSTLLGLFLAVFPLTTAKQGPNKESYLVMSCVVICQFRSSLLLVVSLYLQPVGFPTIPCISCAIFTFPPLACYILQNKYYYLNLHYSRIFLAQFHIGHPFPLSVVALDVDIFPFWYVYDPLFFSVIGDTVASFL